MIRAPLAQSRQRSVGDSALILGPHPEGYAEWLTGVKARVQEAEQKNEEVADEGI